MNSVLVTILALAASAAVSAAPASGPPWTSVRIFVIYFDTETSVHDESNAVIRAAVNYLKSGAPGTLVITGHTDTRGSSESNIDLGLARAHLVADQLIDQGIDRSRLDVNSAGEECPFKPTADGVGELLNRRVEMQFRESMPGTRAGDPAGCHSWSPNPSQ